MTENAVKDVTDKLMVQLGLGGNDEGVRSDEDSDIIVSCSNSLLLTSWQISTKS